MPSCIHIINIMSQPVLRSRVLAVPVSPSWLIMFLNMSNFCCLAFSWACDSCFSLRAVCSCYWQDIYKLWLHTGLSD